VGVDGIVGDSGGIKYNGRIGKNGKNDSNSKH
jgi:hypothetical protein